MAAPMWERPGHLAASFKHSVVDGAFRDTPLHVAICMSRKFSLFEITVDYMRFSFQRCT